MAQDKIRFIVCSLAILGSVSTAAPGLAADPPVYAPQWPNVALIAPAPVSPFKFEIGGRYWYSSGTINFAFANNDPFFGDPTSTLDWKGMIGHSGEIFGRVDHLPTGVFVKGLIGVGTIQRGGEIIDRDYLAAGAAGVKFLDTSSDVTGNNFSYLSADVGYAYHIPEYGIRVGAFAGYQYWREKAAASGLICKTADILLCPNGTVLAAGNEAVFVYEPTWHMLRLGIEGRAAVIDGVSVSGEVVVVPYAKLLNRDSHLLRSDLGPVPNILTKSTSGYGLQAEVFINYAITPNIEIGAGLRYWGMAARNGVVQFGPDFGTNFPLGKFEEQRYGVLLQAKGSF